MKKSWTKLILCFLGDNDEVLFENKITALPLKENFIIEKSIEFFNDPEPCMIHRSAVMKRIYMQMQDFFLKSLEEGKYKLAWEDLPYFMHDALDFPQKVRWICIR